MQWVATDQFGNLYVGACEAMSVEALLPDLESLLEKLTDRAGSEFKVTIDLEYGEINGPDPEQVSHVLQVPWLMGQPTDIGNAVADSIRNLASSRSLDEVEIIVVSG